MTPVLMSCLRGKLLNAWVPYSSNPADERKINQLWFFDVDSKFIA